MRATWITPFAIATCLTIMPSIADADQLSAVTGPSSNAPGDRYYGFAAARYCGNNPESWVRGKAVLDRPGGALVLDMQLETDSTTAGPKGKATVQLKDSQGRILATADSDEVGIGGKPPGKAVSKNVLKIVQIPTNVARATTAMQIDVNCTGTSDKLWGVDWLGFIKDVSVVITAVGNAV